MSYSNRILRNYGYMYATIKLSVIIYKVHNNMHAYFVHVQMMYLLFPVGLFNNNSFCRKKKKIDKIL